MNSQYMRKIIESINEIQEVDDSFQSVFPSTLIDTQPSVSGTHKSYQLKNRMQTAGSAIIFNKAELMELSKYERVILDPENSTISILVR